jgi:hypothetical protein
MAISYTQLLTPLPNADQAPVVLFQRAMLNVLGTGRVHIGRVEQPALLTSIRSRQSRRCTRLPLARADHSLVVRFQRAMLIVVHRRVHVPAKQPAT